MANDIILKRLDEVYAQALYELIDKNRLYLRQWLPWLDETHSEDDVVDFIRSVTKPGEPPDFVICYRGEICGVAGFHGLKKRQRCAALGYWIAQPYTGKGIVSFVVRVLLSIGFKSLQLHKIEIHCAEHNVKSRAVAERNGFVFEGVFRDCEWLYDRYVNHAVYSMLEHEYHNLNTTVLNTDAPIQEKFTPAE